MRIKKEYPKEFIETCNWANEKIAKKRTILNLEVQEKKQVQMLCIGIIFLMLFIIVAFPNQMLKFICWSLLLVTSISVVFYTVFTELKILRKKISLKEDVLGEFAIHLKDGFMYEANGEISESKYRKSGFDRVYNDFSSNCCIEGDRNGRKIGLANIIVKKRFKKNSYRQLFRGAFAYCDLKVDLDEIDIMKVNSTKNKREKDAIAGEGLYMYAESIKEARQVITHEVIQEINSIKKEMKMTLELAIHRNILYIRFYINNINNTLLFGTKEEIEVLYKYYRLINFIDKIASQIEYNVTNEIPNYKSEYREENNIQFIEEDKKEMREEIMNANIDEKIIKPIIVNEGQVNMQQQTNLDKFKIYPKIDVKDYSEEFEREIKSAEGIEIQYFNENGYTSEIDIKTKIDKAMLKYPNIKEITVHPPLENYNIEHILFKNEQIFEKQLYDIIEISKKYNITVNLLYHTHWNIILQNSTGLITKLKKYLKILEGHSSKLILENVMLIQEPRCTVLDICKEIDHPNLKACIDITHIYVRSVIWKTKIINYIKDYLDKELCDKYVYQIHFATIKNNDGYIDSSTHGVEHEDNYAVDFDLQWMKEYNLLNKKIITEVSEKDYRLREKQLKEILMLKSEIQKYM